MKHTLKIFIIIFAFYGCSSHKNIAFKKYIDTSNKTITLQNKETFELKDIGVFANNNFDGARLNDFKKLNDTTAIAYISPENKPINNSPYYAFKIWSKTPKSFYVSLKYPQNYKHRYNPKLKINDEWIKIDSTLVNEFDGLTTIKLNLNSQPQIIAAQKTVNYKDVLKWCENLQLKNNSLVTLKNYGSTALGKKLPVLEINNGFTKEKEVIVLLTRQHPPEITGYFAFQYFLEALLKKSELTKQFFNDYQIIAFPILNPDGVDLGHWRHNANGVDTNRDWSKYNQKEIKQTVQFINNYIKKNKSKVIIGLDFHSTWHDVFYTNKSRKNTTLPNFIDNWFKAIEANYKNYKVNEVSGTSLKPVSKGWFLKAHNAVGITFEIGDNTTEKKIEQIGKIAAKQMQKVLLSKKD